MKNHLVFTMKYVHVAPP